MNNISIKLLCAFFFFILNDQMSRMTLLPGAGMGNRERTGDGGSFASHMTWRHFKIIYLFVSTFRFLATPHGLWDLSSPTRDRSQAHGTESSES